MAFVVMWEAPGLSQEQFEPILRPVFQAQPSPDGRLVHLRDAQNITYPTSVVHSH